MFQEVLENGYRLVCIKPEHCKAAQSLWRFQAALSVRLAPSQIDTYISSTTQTQSPCWRVQTALAFVHHIQHLVRFSQRCPASLLIANLLTQLYIWTLTPDCV